MPIRDESAFFRLVTNWLLIIPEKVALLTHLGINSEDWLELAEHFGKKHHQAVGSLAALNAFAAHTGKQWIGGHRQQAHIFH
jgi:hypothetical protein